VQSDPIPSAGADAEAPGADAADEAPVDPEADPAADPDDPDTDPEADPGAEAPADVPELDELHPATNIAATTSVAPVRDDRRSCALSVICCPLCAGAESPLRPR
jgi:hypothetical protein